MIPGSDSSRRSDNILFAACLIIAVSARLAPAEWTLALSSSIRQTLLAPLLALQQQAELQKSARARFSQVLAQRDSLVVLSEDHAELRRENQELRRLLELDLRLTPQHVSAQVLHQPLPSDGVTLLLSAGSEDGIRTLAPVISPDGLLGSIQGVESQTSTAMTWAHPEFRASAMTENGEVFGIVAPTGVAEEGSAMLELVGVPYLDEVPAGTRLFTSGIGGIYPRGIPIGTVVDVAEDRAGWVRTYLVRPSAQPGSVSHVIVLTGLGEAVGDLFGLEE